MSLTPDQAVEALRDVERARSRSIAFFSYRVSSPQVIMWGIFWFIGYGASDLMPTKGGPIWGAIGVAWFILSFLFSRRSTQKAAAGNKGQAWRFLVIYLTFTVFIFSTVAIMRPRGAEMGAFVPMLVAAMYTILGLWTGWRYSAIGVGIAVLTMGGYFFLPAHFLLWMAFVGGGALTLTGLWLRGA
jgi:hypothetical protein